MKYGIQKIELMKFMNFNDTSIPIGKRKQAYVAWAIKNGTPAIEAKRQANEKFGFSRKGKYVVRIGNADNMDLPSFRNYTWSDAAMDAGCPDPRRCESVIIVCDVSYSSFDICEGFDILPVSWSNFTKTYPTWENCEEWASANGYTLTRVNWLWS